MPNTNTKLKILYIMKALVEKTDEDHGLTVNQIITELEKYDIQAERKSIYSDIALLQDFGMDIDCRKGQANTYHLINRVFELAELKLLVDAVQSSKFITQKKSRELIKKLETQCSMEEAKQLHRQVFVANRIKNINESIYYNVDSLHNAINTNSKIQFHYYEFTLDKKMQPKRNGELYVATPFALTWADDYYYLVAHYERRDELCHFRVDRMMDIEVLSDTGSAIEMKKDFDVAEYVE